MRPLPEFRPHHHHTNNKTPNNGDYEKPAKTNHILGPPPEQQPHQNGTSPAGAARPVTRSKTGKVLRSGRRALLLASHSPPTVYKNHVNGYAKALKNRALNINGISSSSSSSNRSKRRTTPTTTNNNNTKNRQSAYAKHYKSYRRNSSECRRVLSTPPSSSRLHRRRSVDKSPLRRRRPTNQNSPTARRSDATSTRRLVRAKKRVRIVSPSDTTNGASGNKGRRSALWVLNCEAEEFLFGETAADKHELELPPVVASSPPPKKRRRWRETELSHLLETTPFKESKLRSSSSSSSPASSSGGVTDEVAGKSKKIKYKMGERQRKNATAAKKLHLPEEDTNRFLPPPPPPPLSSSSYYYDNMHLLSPRTPVDKGLLLKETLENVRWSYSFETPSSLETWLSTFSRQPADSVQSFKSFCPPPLPPLPPPIVLPYELDKPFLRPRKKFQRNSRKSPRCHASTLAILSDTTVASPESSPLLTTSPPPKMRKKDRLLPPSSPLGVGDGSGPSLGGLLISTKGISKEPPPLLSPFTQFVQENSSARVTRKRSSSASQQNDPFVQYQRAHKGDKGSSPPIVNEQQEYLWDSIQFLSDPYVVSLLAGEEPTTTTHSLVHNNNNNNNNGKGGMATRSRHASQDKSNKAVVVVSPPKCSPSKVQSGKNGVLTIPPSMRSPPPPQPQPPPPPQYCKRTSPLSPVVMVADILKGKGELLFVRGSEGLPSLPTW